MDKKYYVLESKISGDFWGYGPFDTVSEAVALCEQGGCPLSIVTATFAHVTTRTISTVTPVEIPKPSPFSTE